MFRGRVLPLVGVLCLTCSVAAFARSGYFTLYVPMVQYREPRYDAVIDLRGRSEILFRWDQVPIPAGGREAYRILINEEPGYKSIFKKTLDERTFSVTVPAALFREGVRYSWYVRQRDGRSFDWSRYERWYFTVHR